MVRLFSVLLGMISFCVISVIGYCTNVSFFNILIRGVIAFFIFYVLGMLVGVILVKNILEILQRKRDAHIAEENAMRELELEEMRKAAARAEAEAESNQGKIVQ